MPVPGKFNSHLIIFTVLLAAALTSACAPSNGNPTPVLSSTATATASVPAVTRTLLPNPTATGTPFPTPTSAPTDQPIGVANATDLRLIRTAGDGSLGALALSPDGRILAAAGSRGFWLFDKFTLELIARGAPEIGAITRVAWSPDGLRIATGGQDGAVRIWEMLHDPENGRVILDQVALLAGHAVEVRALAWSPDGARIASGGDDEMIRVWNTATFRNSLIQAHTSAVYALDWHPGSELILIGEFDGSISVTNGVTGENYASFLAQDGWINAVRWSPDGARAVSGGLDRTLRIWELTPAFALKELGIYGTLYAISTIAWSTDGEYIALAGGTPYTIELINPATANETNRSLSSEGVFSGHSGPTSGLVFAPGGVLFSSGQDNTLRAWNLATRQELRRLSSGPAAAFTSGLNVVDWSPDGIQAATGGADGTLQIWDVSTGETTRLISAHNGIITSLDWSPGGNWIVTGGSDNFSRLWDAQTGELLQELRSEGGQVNAVALSPFNNFIASGGFFRIGQIWQAGTDRAPTLIYPDVEITALGWASSGTLLALGGNDGTVRLYNGQTGADLGILSKEQNTNIVAVAWEPLGGRIAAMDRRGTIVIWESSSGEVLAKHTGDGRIWSGLSWAPNGVLATGSEDGVIKLFDTATLVPLSIHAVHSAAVNDLAFSPRGSRLLSAGSDGADVLRLFAFAAGRHVELDPLTLFE